MPTNRSLAVRPQRFARIGTVPRRPPRTLPDAQAVAVELWAACNESGPGMALRGTGEIATHIIASPIWQRRALAVEPVLVWCCAVQLRRVDDGPIVLCLARESG